MKPCVFLDVFLVCCNYYCFQTSNCTEVCSMQGRSWTAPNGSPAQQWRGLFHPRGDENWQHWSARCSLTSSAQWGTPVQSAQHTSKSGLIKALLAVSWVTCRKVPACPVSRTEAWKQFLIICMKKACVSDLQLMNHFRAQDLHRRTKWRQGVGWQGTCSPTKDWAGVLKNEVHFEGE